eukprot:m.447259 g.447259  ORF g.447259 m.447259 type:complete len:360 (-) comp19492_c0_seq1:24-1103(-)
MAGQQAQGEIVALPNSAEAQIARMFGAKKPTSEAITKYTEQQTATDRLATSAYAPACDQVAKLLGSATPSSEQIKAYCARTAPAAAAADGELSAADLKLLAELEGQTALLAKQLCGIASGVDTARDALDKVGAASGLKPLARKGRRGLVACEEAAAKAATPRTVTAGQSPVWTGLVGALNAGSLSVDPQDTVLVRLCALVSAMAPAVKVAHRGPSSLTYAKGTVSGTTSVLFALFPALLGKDRATQAKVLQWCMDGVDPKFAQAEAEPAADRKRAATQKIVQGLNAALGDTAYLAGNSLTLADLVMWAAVRELFPALHQAEREALPNVTRWFKHIQSAPGLTREMVTISANCVMPVGAH